MNTRTRRHAGSSAPIGIWRAAAIALACATAACSNSPSVTPADLNRAYEDALEQTSNAADFAPGADAAPLARLREFFVDMDAASVATAAQVYAPDAVLYDNLAVVYGASDIEAYFTKAVGEVDGLQVEFQQTTRAGIDYYIRWRMTIVSESLSPGQPLVSYGMTHFRFDEQGRVLLHRDFWDAASGLYEYLPVVGGLITRLRETLGELP